MIDQATEVDVLARLFEPDVLDDPGPFFAWLREHLPVHRHRSGSYFVARHADTKWVFQTPLLRGIEPGELTALFPRMARYRAFELLADSVVHQNPPKHTALRRMLTRDFTVKRVTSLRPAMERACDALFDQIAGRLQDGLVVDLHSELTLPFAQSVVFDLVGIDAADRQELTPLVATVMHSTSPAATDEMMTAADAATERIEAVCTALVAQRRARPRDDLVSAFISTHDDDEDQFTQDDLMCALWGMWVGGFETVAASLSHAAIMLMRDPGLAHWLRGGPTEVRAYFEETLRYRTVSHFNGAFRIAVEDIELGGLTIPAGSDVRGLPGCANRDPAVFPEPDRFDPSRDPSAMLGFGHGIHYCVGSNLAKAEGEVLLPRLQARFPTLTLAEPPMYRTSPPILTCDRLAVALEGR